MLGKIGAVFSWIKRKIHNYCTNKNLPGQPTALPHIFSAMPQNLMWNIGCFQIGHIFSTQMHTQRGNRIGQMFRL